MQELLWVAVGGGAGSVARYAVGRAFASATTFPWGTFVVNTAGSAVAGFLAGFFAARMSGSLRLGVLVGFLGGFTTFSTFALESAGLMRDAQSFTAGLNLVASVVVGLLAAIAGLVIGESLAR